MDIEVKTDSLKKVVSCASRATSSKAIQPILNNILLESKKGSLIVAATDLDISIECKLPAEVENPGKITLPAKKLEEIINKVSGEDVNFSIDKNQLTKITSNKSKFQINGTSSEEYPEVIKEKESEKEYTIDQEELLRAVTLTSFATSKFDTTSVLSGVNLEINGNRFEVGATDGSRLARYVGKTKGKGKGGKQPMVIPFRAMAELEKLINVFKSNNDEVTIKVNQGQVVFQNKDFTMSTRLIDGKFPEYDNLIPEKQKSFAVFKRSELLSSLERVAILANERTSVVKVSLSKKGKTATVSANSPDYGKANDEVEVDYKGEDMEIAFNYRYLAEALRNLDKDTVKIELDSSLSPILLKLDEENEKDLDFDYTYLVMPVQMR